MDKKKILYLVLGPSSFALVCFFIPVSLFPELEARAALGTVLWMSIWWVAAPVDFAVTAFLPIIINAFIPMVEMPQVISNYSSETILLLLGGSIITVSWEITGLDKRIAAMFLSLIGGNLRQQLVFWFLLSCLLSTVLPNAVVCATITPIAVSMLKYVGENEIAKSEKGSLILLTIVYAVGVGGLASPLGGAMNLITVDYIEQITGKEYFYLSWIWHFLPVMLVLVISNIAFLLMFTKREDDLGGTREFFISRYKEMDRMKNEEKIALTLFVVATILSFTRQLYQSILPGLKPAYVFLLCGMLVFFIRRDDDTPLVRWQEAQKKIIWEMIYIFAGGMAVGTLINKSNAAEYLGSYVSSLGLTGGFFTVLVIVTMTLLLSDVTSNTATAAVAMPIVISIVQGIGLNPIPYIYITSIGVNLSYMLPTSIRAIPVGYGLQPSYLLKKGVPITIIVIALMTIISYLMLQYWPAFSIA